MPFPYQPVLDVLAEMIAYDRDLKIHMSTEVQSEASLESMFASMPPIVGLD